MAENPQFLKSDATVNYQKDLVDKMDQQYPFVKSVSSPVLVDYQNGVYPFVSFGIRDPKLVKLILPLALQKASDIQNGVTYSTHGAQHEVYQESLLRLKESVNKGKIIVGFQSQIKGYQSGKSTEFPIERLIVQGEKYDRNVLRPIPHQTAVSLPSNEKALIKKIRDLTRQNGIPFGILVSLYKGLDAQQIFDILGNQDFRRSFPKDTKHFHVSHEEDRKMITPLSKALIKITPSGRHPIMSSDAYSSGIGILKQYGWAIPNSITGTNYGFCEVHEQPFPRAIFAGMVQIAQEQAGLKFRDPARTEYIYGKYEGIATTNLITSFLVFDK